MTVSPDLVDRLLKRAEIRRQIPGRKSVMEGAPDRISDLLEEAAGALESAQAEIARLRDAAERGLEWAIDAANERKSKDAVFENAMKDIRRIEAALKDSPNVG